MISTPGARDRKYRSCDTKYSSSRVDPGLNVQWTKLCIYFMPPSRMQRPQGVVLNSRHLLNSPLVSLNVLHCYLDCIVSSINEQFSSLSEFPMIGFPLDYWAFAVFICLCELLLCGWGDDIFSWVGHFSICLNVQCEFFSIFLMKRICAKNRVCLLSLSLTHSQVNHTVLCDRRL